MACGSAHGGALARRGGCACDAASRACLGVQGEAQRARTCAKACPPVATRAQDAQRRCNSSAASAHVCARVCAFAVLPALSPAPIVECPRWHACMPQCTCPQSSGGTVARGAMGVSRSDVRSTTALIDHPLLLAPPRPCASSCQDTRPSRLCPLAKSPRWSSTRARFVSGANQGARTCWHPGTSRAGWPLRTVRDVVDGEPTAAACSRAFAAGALAVLRLTAPVTARSSSGSVSESSGPCMRCDTV